MSNNYFYYKIVLSIVKNNIAPGGRARGPGVYLGAAGENYCPPRRSADFCPPVALPHLADSPGEGIREGIRNSVIFLYSFLRFVCKGNEKEFFFLFKFRKKEMKKWYFFSLN